MRQLFSILPPRMVSRKWTSQLSSAMTLPMAAAMPPSAMTVWALPSSDLQIRPVFAPWAEASIAARSPAPPAPTTTTSNSCVSKSLTPPPLEEPRIVDHAGRQQPDVEVGEGHPDEARPRVLHVPAVQLAEELPRLEPDGRLGEQRQPAPAQVPARVARQRVEPDQRRVDHEDQRAEAHPPPVGEMERLDGIEGQHGRDRRREVQEVAVDVLQDQREPRLARVPGVRLGDRTGGRREPERAVVRLAVVVAGEPEAKGEDEDQ